MCGVAGCGGPAEVAVEVKSEEVVARSEVVDAPRPIAAVSAEPVVVALPEVAVACAGGRAEHTLAVVGERIFLDGVAQVDADAAGEALRAAKVGELALAIDAGLTLHKLRPVLQQLQGLEARLFVGVRSQEARDELVVAIAGVEIEAAAPKRSAGQYEAGYLMFLDNAGVDVYDLVETKREVPADVSLAGAAVVVAATEDTRWGAIAGGLVRACGGARLIETTQAPGGGLPTITRTKGRPPPALSPDDVRRRVRAHISEVWACYKQGLARDPQLTGRVSVQFQIDARGAVKRAEVVGSTIADPAVGACIVKAARRWRFPRPTGGHAEFTYPFVLEPG